MTIVVRVKTPVSLSSLFFLRTITCFVLLCGLRVQTLTKQSIRFLSRKYEVNNTRQLQIFLTLFSTVGKILLTNSVTISSRMIYMTRFTTVILTKDL